MTRNRNEIFSNMKHSQGGSPPSYHISRFLPYVFEVISSESLSANAVTIVPGLICLIILRIDSSSEERFSIEDICSSIHFSTPSVMVLLFVMYLRGRGNIRTVMNPSLVKRFNRS